MDEVLWNAARRLAHLVVAWLLVVGLVVGYDSLARRSGSPSLALCAWALVLVLVAIALMARAAWRSKRPDRARPSSPGPYRSPGMATAAEASDGPPSASSAKARTAATALALLALATSFLVVAAAAR